MPAASGGDTERISGGDERSEVSPEEKFLIVQNIMPILAGNAGFLLTGSLAAQISTLEENGRCVLGPADLSVVSDIDIGTTADRRSQSSGVFEAIKEAVAHSPFKIEIGMIYANCVYHPAVRDLAVRWADVEIGGAGAVPYHIAYTTPEFLLVSLLGGDVNQKTQAEKYRRKVVAIQAMPKFSPFNFRALAHHEVDIRYPMNKQTFNLWDDDR